MAFLDAVRESVHGLIEEVLDKNEFVQLVGIVTPERKPSDPPPPFRDACFLSTMTSSKRPVHGDTPHEFIFELEKRSVYDLMLASQKAMLHKFTALYLQQGRTSREDGMDLVRSPAHLNAEGRHWEATADWSGATNFHYRLALLLDSRRHLVPAHQMLGHMRRRVNALLRVQSLLDQHSRRGGNP